MFVLAFFVGFVPAAWAQDLGQAEPADTAGSRAQPGYDPLGIRRGLTTFYPELSIVTTAESNVFAQERDGISDVSVTMVPSVRADYDRQPTRLSFQADARVRRYAKLQRQNDEQYRARLNGGFELSRDTRLAANVEWSTATVARGNFENILASGDPLRRRTLSGDAELSHRFNRLQVRARASGESFHFNDVRLDDGTVLDQSFRNGRRLGGSLGLTYNLSPRVGLVARGEITDFSYEDPRPDRNRDATNYAITGGVRYELSELLIAELRAGVRNHRFRSAAFNDVSGLALGGRLRWYPTPLLSVRFDLGQQVTTSSLDTVSAVTATTGSLEADYELRRNILLSIRADGAHERFSGVSANSQRLALTGRATWKTNRWLHLSSQASFERRTGSADAIAPRFDAFRFLLTATIAR